MKSLNKILNKWGFLVPLAFVATIYGCVSVINFDVDEEEESQLVIQGEITTNPGPYTVEIYRTVPFFDAVSNTTSNRVNNAIVTLYDLDGAFERLEMVSNGIYQTSPTGIQGQLGHSYFISVEIGGEIYQSSVQVINPVPDIDSISLDVSFQSVTNSLGVITEDPYVDVFVNFQDNPEERNFYLWKWNGTVQRKTFPELFTIRVDGTPTISPLPCSQANGVQDCTCCNCWVKKTTRNPLSVFNDQFSNGSYITGRKAFSIPATADNFDVRTYLNVQQFSLNEDVYDFWDQIAKQNETQSSLFAVPSSEVAGNIRNINKEDELVWGTFSASAIEDIQIFIDQNDLGIRIPSDSINNSCLILSNSTNQKPSFWVD
ncbi:MAG: DUF4249 domain-containing protein [bacterium]|nr:DUF4249 domain-containing protein [bacterium]